MHVGGHADGIDLRHREVLEPVRNLADIEGHIARLEVLDFDSAAATQAGQIRAELARAGTPTPIGPYDQMIAGHARSRGLIVVTNNLAEFSRVSGLRLENWVAGR